MKPILDNPRLTAYALGEMNPADRATFEAERPSLPDGLEEIAAIRRAAKSLNSALRSEASRGQARKSEYD